MADRVSKYAYGIEFSRSFDSTNPEHRNRESATHIDASGDRLVPNGFDVILPRATQVSETTTFRRSYCWVFKDRAQVEKTISVGILCYRGTGMFNNRTEMFAKLCTVVSPTPPYEEYLKTKSQYYQISYDVVLNFGLTELTAHIEWTESGVIKTSPASVVYDIDILSD
ncbi:hypothetical protein H0H93_007611 [Arthromyces matolae]|nr:hypothetical protein H0H93_007611 [Arthromyces matolae]